LTKLTIKEFCDGVDQQIELVKGQKQWYLDYRTGSGMSPMLEEFAKVLDDCIAKLELMKQVAKNIDPQSLLGRLG